MNNPPVISCAGLKKTYSDGDLTVEVLKGVELEVNRGETVAIIGASGSGKSTLLHLLGALDSPTEGEISINGQSLAGLDETRKGQLRNHNIGFVYQFHHLLPEFTALENVAMPLVIRGDGIASADQSAVEMLTAVGLDHRLRHKPAELSGGERQRAAIARAIITRPGCILADEPTGNLDEHTSDSVFDVMLNLNRELGLSLVLVTHNLALAGKLDRVLTLQDGKLETA